MSWETAAPVDTESDGCRHLAPAPTLSQTADGWHQVEPSRPADRWSLPPLGRHVVDLGTAHGWRWHAVHAAYARGDVTVVTTVVRLVHPTTRAVLVLAWTGTSLSLSYAGQPEVPIHEIRCSEVEHVLRGGAA